MATISVEELKKYVEEWDEPRNDAIAEMKNPDWSEEDESRMENLCYFLEEYGTQYYGYLTLLDTISWLKSLKPKNTWKPSDEQLEALDFAADCIVPDEFCFKRKILKDLLAQLKKLREE